MHEVTIGCLLLEAPGSPQVGHLGADRGSDQRRARGDVTRLSRGP
jgi:hypothetical protein